MNFTDTIKALAGKRYRVERGEDGFYQVPLKGTARPAKSPWRGFEGCSTGTE